VSAVAVLLWATATWLLLPTLADLVNLAQCLARRGRAAPDPGPQLPRLLFLVPAHNEEKSIGACLTSLQQMDYPPSRLAIVVVADNCDDATASVAGATGGQCLVRVDPERPGKPHALAWALDRLPVADFDAVAIVDADTEVAPDFAHMLAESGAARNVALQPYNAVLNRTRNALTRMAAVLSSANHQYAFRLKSCAGCNVPLSVGMCLGTDILRSHGWAAFSIGEDWEWYAQLTAEGIRVRSAWRGRISAQEAVSLRQSGPQRRRWMLGKGYVLLTVGPRILMSRRASTAQKLDAIAELTQLGPVLQLTLVGFGVAVATLGGIPNGAPLTIALLTSLVRPAVYSSLAMIADPQPGRALLAFGYLPVYAAWRIANALWGLLTLRDRRWVRTQRPP